MKNTTSSDVQERVILSCSLYEYEQNEAEIERLGLKKIALSWDSKKLSKDPRFIELKEAYTAARDELNEYKCLKIMEYDK